MIKNNTIEKELTTVITSIKEITCESKDLKNILNNFLSSKSKYIRTQIACLLLKTLGISLTENHYNIMIATELIHNASLIHDDAIDNSNTRRNKRTINANFDNKLSIIVGDYLLSKANKFLLKTNSLNVIKNYSECIEKMCIGESNQYFSKFTIPTLEDYIQKSCNKTAELFYVMILSLLEDNNPMHSEFDCLEFAINFGIAFQIKNDLDDYMQKENSSDIKEGVYTAPIILIHSIDYQTIAIEKTFDLIHNYGERTKNSIRNIADSEYKTALIGITD